MICTSLQNKTYTQILEILEDPTVEMAEIRLDLCPLSDEEIEELFSESDTPLIATCRLDGCASPDDATHRLYLAIASGARFSGRIPVLFRIEFYAERRQSFADHGADPV